MILSRQYSQDSVAIFPTIRGQYSQPFSCHFVISRRPGVLGSTSNPVYHNFRFATTPPRPPCACCWRAAPYADAGSSMIKVRVGLAAPLAVPPPRPRCSPLPPPPPALAGRRRSCASNPTPPKHAPPPPLSLHTACRAISRLCATCCVPTALVAPRIVRAASLQRGGAGS